MARRREEGVHQVTLASAIAAPLHVPTRLGGGPGWPDGARSLRSLHKRSDVREGNRKKIVKEEGNPVGRSQGLEDQVQCGTDRVTEQQLTFGFDLTGVGIGSGSSIGSSARDFRERNRSRHTRETTVVSQPPRLVMLFCSARLSRSHASWTASSASSTSRASAEPPPAGGAGDARRVEPAIHRPPSVTLPCLRSSGD